MTNVFTKRILILGCLLWAGYALAQMAPGTKVIRFKLPLFNEEGRRAWYLRGEEGEYVSTTQIKIKDMNVGQYSGDGQDRRIAVLTSPEAIFHFDSTTAYGPGQLHIETDTFQITGYDWIWQGEKKEITINDGVTVTLYEGIGDILK